MKKQFKAQMKKLILLACVVVLTSCKKEDITPPFIKLLGDNPLTHKLKDSFQDPGYTAHDQEDGDITSKVVVNSTLNTQETGSYTIQYLVTDASGRSASASRTVLVKNQLELDQQTGNYAVVDSMNGAFRSTATLEMLLQPKMEKLYSTTLVDTQVEV